MAERVLLRTDALVVRGVRGTAAAIRLPHFPAQRLLVTGITYIPSPPAYDGPSHVRTEMRKSLQN